MQDDSTQTGLSAVIRPDGSAELIVDETPQQIPTTLVEDARREIVRRAAEIAELLDGPVHVTVHEPDGDWPLLVHPDGRVDSDEGSRSSAAPGTVEAPAAPETPADAPVEEGPEPAEPSAERPASADATATTAPEPSAPGTTAVPASAPAAEGIVPAGSATAPGPVRAGNAPDAAAPAVPGPVRSGNAPVAAAPATAGPVPAAASDGAGPRPGADAPPRRRTSAPSDVAPDSAAVPDSAAAPEEQGRRSFLTSEQSAEELATRGWRGALVRAGARIPPGAAERAERDDQAAVAQHWFGPRTIAVVNGKGGAGKTPTTILTAAVFARFGGAGVLAWDNNQTRGTLGWRTEQGPHDATLHELLPETGHLLSSSAQAADLARFVHHQTRDRFDVLRSKPMVLAEQQRIHSDDVDRIHAVAAKYYRLIVMDSGNDESDPMWLRMIDHTDQIVVATTSRAEHAEAGALLLEALATRDARSAALAQNAVAVVSQADPNAPSNEHRKVVDGYRALARDVVSIPYDPAMIGGLLHYGALRPATQRAWLSAAAAAARGLGGASA
ncbi:ATPase [Microbacterium betulae]|uniref:ATPase n=1 Tax=Microbacterium betulae TaxID=2981139 RepID=A0AA97FFF7_9MICO|nr:ATPase [Microbacterium sp. AB]WOF22536.1 ATPase [Microbacterium sp. AB]